VVQNFFPCAGIGVGNVFQPYNTGIVSHV
jgi:hypothetical protein